MSGTYPVLLHDRYETLKAFMEALGDDVSISILKCYVAFKRLRNFACINFVPTRGEIGVWVELEDRFTHDVRGIRHYGTGDLEITIKNDEDLEKAKPLIVKIHDSV